MKFRLATVFAAGLLATAPVFEEAALLADLDLQRIAPVRYDNPLLADLESGFPLLLPDLLRLLGRAAS